MHVAAHEIGKVVGPAGAAAQHGRLVAPLLQQAIFRPANRAAGPGEAIRRDHYFPLPDELAQMLVENTRDMCYEEWRPAAGFRGRTLVLIADGHGLVEPKDFCCTDGYVLGYQSLDRSQARMRDGNLGH